MDGQTDIPPLAIPAVCIARYANALVIIQTDRQTDRETDTAMHLDKQWTLEHQLLH